MVPPSIGIIDNLRVMAVVAHMQRSERAVVRERIGRTKPAVYRRLLRATFVAAWSWYWAAGAKATI